MTDCELTYPDTIFDCAGAETVNDVSGCGFVGHGDIMTNNWSLRKTTLRTCGHISGHASIAGMKDLIDRPHGEMASRIKWHREVIESLTQVEYAKRIGTKRGTLNNWESGDYRISLNGALSLRRKFGLSLDFIYEGIDDALPMTLRAAWRDRPEVSASK